MTESIEKLNTYLVQARGSVNSADAGEIVIGNEAADLDSMVSAILYGQLASACRARHAALVAAVINCPRADFVLRTEAVYLFAELGVDVATLLFIDEIDLDSLHRAGRLRLTLVDHNILCTDQEKYADAVAAIIDHHTDGGLYPQAEPRLIEPVGSATTLVAEAMLRDRPELISVQSATLMLGTILLDTVYLDPAAERVTPKDRAIATRLAEVAGSNTDDLFAKLQAEKFNLSELGTNDLLRKDYKAWDTPSGSYGISTVLISLEGWIARDPGFVAGLDTFLRSRDLVSLVVMLAYTDAGGDFCRELVIYAADPVLAESLTVMLGSDDLELNRIRPAGLLGLEHVKLYSQRNTSISRKKLQPVLHRFFSSRSPGS